MSRSLKKGPYVEESLLRRVEKMKASGKSHKDGGGQRDSGPP